VPAGGLDDYQRRAEENRTDPAHQGLTDLEDDRDQRSNQLHDQEECAGDGSADPREKSRERRADWAQPASGLVYGPT
jgi:hypothetical protein